MNTIYDYYHKLSDRYYIAHRSGKLFFEWDLKARPVIVPGYEEFDLYLHREDKEIFLCEGLTGIVLLRQCNIEERMVREGGLQTFIDFLPGELSVKGGRAWLNKRMYDFILDNNRKVSPRYKIKENIKDKQR